MSDISSQLEKLNRIEIIEPPLPIPEKQIILEKSNDQLLLVQNDDCSLFIADSSLSSNSGFGIFTMKSVKKGDIIIPSQKRNKVFNVYDSKDNDGNESISSDFYNPYMMFMKQHSLYDNVNGGVDSSAIVASRDIEEGEELFFKYDDYSSDFKSSYQRLHPHDPTTTLFEKVDDITGKLIESIPMHKIQIKSKTKQYKQKQKPKYKTEPVIDATMLIQLFKDTLQDYDRVLADLLPSTHSEAKSLIEAGGKEKYLSNKRSTDWLSTNGVCVDGLHSSAESDTGVFASRSVLKGDILTTSPLYAVLSNNENDKEHCFCVNKGELLLCPLSISSYINEGVLSSQCDIESRNDCPNNIANAHYEWSKLNKLNNNIDGISTADLLKVRKS